MTEKYPLNLRQAASELEQATREAKELTERLAEDLRQQTQREEQGRIKRATAPGKPHHY